MKNIKEEYSLGRQSLNYSQILEAPSGLRLKISIKSDSYDFQSHAKIEVFQAESLSWNLVSSIPYNNMKTPTKLHAGINASKDQTTLKQLFSRHFTLDRTTLIEDCSNILGDLLTKKLDNKKEDENSHVDKIKVPLKTNKKIKLA